MQLSLSLYVHSWCCCTSLQVACDMTCAYQCHTQYSLQHIKQTAMVLVCALKLCLQGVEVLIIVSQ
jgi:hypothetical protein